MSSRVGGTDSWELFEDCEAITGIAHGSDGLTVTSGETAEGTRQEDEDGLVVLKER